MAKILGNGVHVGVVIPGLDGLRLGGGVDHQSLDSFNVKVRFGRVGKGGVVSCDIKPIVQIPLVAGTAALEGSGSFTKIPGPIVQVAGDGARPAVGTGNRRNERAERDGFHCYKVLGTSW